MMKCFTGSAKSCKLTVAVNVAHLRNIEFLFQMANIVKIHEVAKNYQEFCMKIFNQRNFPPKNSSRNEQIIPANETPAILARSEWQI